jgi:hypothetical protein
MRWTHATGRGSGGRWWRRAIRVACCRGDCYRIRGGRGRGLHWRREWAGHSLGHWPTQPRAAQADKIVVLLVIFVMGSGFPLVPTVLVQRTTLSVSDLMPM